MLFKLWGKADRNFNFDGQTSERSARDFHPLIFHLLDVAACSEELLRVHRRHLEVLAEACNAKADDLAGLFICLIALHDIGKCARGFQAKVLDLWPEYLGPRPDELLSGRHDAAGVWLFDKNEKLKKLVAERLTDTLPGRRLKLIQAVCGHHGQPTEQANGVYPVSKNTSAGRTCSPHAQG